MDVGLDWWDEGGQSLSAGLGLLSLLVLLPLLPAVEPRVVILALIQVDIEAPVDCTKPLVFQRVKLLHRNAAHFRP